MTKRSALAILLAASSLAGCMSSPPCPDPDNPRRTCECSGIHCTNVGGESRGGGSQSGGGAQSGGGGESEGGGKP